MLSAGSIRLAIWYNDVEAAGIEAFKTVARSVQQHYEAILNPKTCG
ncbi:transposase [Mucilaginibacter rubeus]|uniref:Transposase n=1 Tax=Mucilaginibacter rubeus TaxID=2027860 RepID=A0AAE6JMQ8_9SPHI|nr:transposase [Mucilaginibacter rubeus]QEM20613.1 transposase [Mucilaginibacter gossypii]QTE47130.1 transposase [Mucilaginibacter rubeus]QTE53731.1 transposase [Mucilaginibacter rubeus]QTE60235.1 transposase [Mucilaginibacter rubeus]